MDGKSTKVPDAASPISLMEQLRWRIARKSEHLALFSRVWEFLVLWKSRELCVCVGKFSDGPLIDGT